MSFQTNKTFAYYHQGKVVEIYRITTGVDGVIDTLDGYKMIVPSSGGTTGVQYPDETIPNGIRVEYTALVKPFVEEDPESTAYGSLTEVTSPNELSHLNLNRMLSAAIVDYLRAMMAEREGDLEKKEYYMRNFKKKVSNNESNKNKIYIVQSTSYAVK
tara:strand:- start:52 stop:525 length:474 start_codon:yes stop_codon:yes gene_type:complete